MSFSVSREQLIRCVRDHGWTFHRAAKTKKTELWEKKGSTKYLALPHRSFYPEAFLRPVLAQAGFTTAEVEQFLKDAVKEPADKR